MANRHIELMVAYATAAAVGGSAAAAAVGDSLTIKNARKGARIINCWCDLQAAGALQIVRPSGHDTTRDARIRVPASECELLLPWGIPMEVDPQETLGITIFEAATAGDVANAGFLMEYDELPGIAQRLISPADVQKRIEKFVTLDASIAAVSGALGAFAASEELITSESDLLKANRDYAVLGYKVSVECGAFYIKGPDTGNLRVGGPGNDLDSDLTANWFLTLSRAYNRDMVPVINSGNKNSTFIGVHQDENAAAVPVTIFLALLKEGRND